MEIIALKLTETVNTDNTQNFLKLVDFKKRERLQRFAKKEDFLRGLFSDLLVRYILITKFKYKNEHIKYKVNKFGKPYLIGCKNLHFNVSHSGDWIICGFDNTPIGIDIEKIKELDFSLDLILSKNEKIDFTKQQNKREYFFSIWTLKESYIKYLGIGLNYQLQDISFTISNKDIHISVKNIPLFDLFFKQYYLESGYKTAICSENKLFPKSPTLIDVHYLIDFFNQS